MNIAIDGTFYWMGYAAHFLGLPRNHPSENFIKDAESRSFRDGWDDCLKQVMIETKVDKIKKAVRERQLSVFWVNDNNEEIENA